MYNNDTDNYSQSAIECLETEEKEMPSAFHETCENDDLEITALGNAADNEISTNNDSSSDEKSNNEIKINSGFGVQDISDICLICENKIYSMEKLIVDAKLYHKNCFRCVKCRKILSVSNFTLSNNDIYCKTHFMELFKIRGKFDDHGEIQNEIVTSSETETIPTVDTKGILAKFREMETGNLSTPAIHNTNRSNSNSTQRYTQPSDDIVRSGDFSPDELPPPETAKAMVAKFKAMESNRNVPSPVCVEKMQLRAKASSTSNANVRLHSNNSHASVNEDEYNTAESLPEEGTTRILMNKFQGL